MKRGRPIKPDEVEEFIKKKKKIPEFIFDIFNDLIQEAALEQNKIFKVLQKDVVQRVNKKTGTKDWPRWWLDVEEDYRNEGWKVEYDKPAYCESYDPRFYFEKKMNT